MPYKANEPRRHKIPRARYRGHGRIRRKTRVKNRKPSSISVLNAYRCARGSDGQRRRALFSRFVHTSDTRETARKCWAQQGQNQRGLVHSRGVTA